MGGRGLGAAQVDLVLDQPAVDRGPVQDLEEQPVGELAGATVHAVGEGELVAGVASRWYAVPPVAQERILRAAAVLHVRNLVAVCDWPPVAVRRD
jgi:hypothetical protein